MDQKVGNNYTENFMHWVD